MRMMSFALTEAQLLDGSKTVTRRTGWKNLKVGERLSAVRKSMGLKPGEKVVRLCEIEVVNVRTVRADDVSETDCAREGFPYLTPAEFVSMFAKKMNVRTPMDETWLTRIEFRKVPGSDRVVAQQSLGLPQA